LRSNLDDFRSICIIRGMSVANSETAGARTERAERTRRRILDAACHCFAASGYAKTTVEEIALQAGVSKGLVYHHFRGKEQILEAVLERTLADWDAATGRPSGSVPQAVEITARRRVCRKICARSVNDPRFADMCGAAVRRSLGNPRGAGGRSRWCASGEP
jgi:AcrR family transcriptional regulator